MLAATTPRPFRLVLVAQASWRPDRCRPATEAIKDREGLGSGAPMAGDTPLTCLGIPGPRAQAQADGVGWRQIAWLVQRGGSPGAGHARSPLTAGCGGPGRGQPGGPAGAIPEALPGLAPVRVALSRPPRKRAITLFMCRPLTLSEGSLAHETGTSVRERAARAAIPVDQPPRMGGLRPN
jgi:hypothetical protein